MLRFTVLDATLFIASVLAVLLVAAAVATAVLATRIDRRFPAEGKFITVNGTRLHYVDEGPRTAMPVLLIHGASSNIRDMLGPMRQQLGQRYRLIAIDRPGHGWSERGTNHNSPDAQARTLADALGALGVDKAIIYGHSFGAAVATALAVERPDKVAGLLVAAPATHPWPSGTTNWYNHFARLPFVGWLFTRTIALPAGLQRLPAATACVFSPNRMPDDYLARTGVELVLVPRRFMANSIDLTGLHGHTTAFAPRYAGITAPTIIIAGEHDNVVSKDIHAVSLAKAVPGAQLFLVPNIGHKPDYVLADLVAAAIDTLAGTPRDLAAIAKTMADVVAADRFGPLEACPPPYNANAVQA
ncbi:MAG: alpha/beta hydrolase [Phyllobacteriaceae bacterium]|nr:alpha/beta hydrolase [Phyllobacteriaceae bacterium]